MRTRLAAIPVVADARVTLEQLCAALPDYKVSADYAAEISNLKDEWEAEVDRLFHLNNPGRPAQSEVIGAIWEASGPRDVLLSAAGSHPGDLHKLWRTRTPNGYHMEYGYSCMGVRNSRRHGREACRSQRAKSMSFWATAPT